MKNGHFSNTTREIIMEIYLCPDCKRSSMREDMIMYKITINTSMNTTVYNWTCKICWATHKYLPAMPLLDEETERIKRRFNNPM